MAFADEIEFAILAAVVVSSALLACNSFVQELRISSRVCLSFGKTLSRTAAKTPGIVSLEYAAPDRFSRGATTTAPIRLVNRDPNSGRLFGCLLSAKELSLPNTGRDAQQQEPRSFHQK